ncbi:MAG TPA: hypothetical protein VMR98_05800, partial [Candidatus Polarisedimenticolaceae bacterium]|nr:hypothetical protein [Candidatus Polarisedimenticolaceae bacterium]
LRMERQRYLLPEFAKDNGFNYEDKAPGLNLPGMLFWTGNLPKTRKTEAILSGSYEGQRFITGNHYFDNHAGGRINTYDYGFIGVELPRSLPQILLRSKRKAMEFTANFKSDQVLQLEGDFGKYFILYCPKGYEQDALYVLTPDLMQLLISHGSNFDIEITGNSIFFYHHPFTVDQRQAEEIFAVIATLGNATTKRTLRYQNQLARFGIFPRLKSGFITIILINLLLFGLLALRYLLR